MRPYFCHDRIIGGAATTLVMRDFIITQWILLAIIKVSQRAIALVEVKRPAADGLETEGFLITFAGIERFAILINITQCLDVHYVTVIRQSDSGSGSF